MLTGITGKTSIKIKSPAGKNVWQRLRRLFETDSKGIKIKINCIRRSKNDQPNGNKGSTYFNDHIVAKWVTHAIQHIAFFNF